MPELAEQFFCKVTRWYSFSSWLGLELQESFTAVSGALEEVARGWTRLCTSPYTGFLHGIVAWLVSGLSSKREFFKNRR